MVVVPVGLANCLLSTSECRTCFWTRALSLSFASTTSACRVRLDSAISACRVRRTFCSEVRSSSVWVSRASVFSSFSSNSCHVGPRLESRLRNPRTCFTSINSDLLSSRILNWVNRSRYVVGTGTTGTGTGTGTTGTSWSDILLCEIHEIRDKLAFKGASACIGPWAYVALLGLGGFACR
jgi:hypothetical protein